MRIRSAQQWADILYAYSSFASFEGRADASQQGKMLN